MQGRVQGLLSVSFKMFSLFIHSHIHNHWLIFGLRGRQTELRLNVRG